jgi:hypothetical protein
MSSASWVPAQIKDISITDGGKKVVIINKAGFKKEFTALAGKLVASTMVDGAEIKIKCTDGKTVIKWNPVTGTYRS